MVELEPISLAEALAVAIDSNTGNTILILGASKSGKTTLMIKALPIIEMLKMDTVPILMGGNVSAGIYTAFNVPKFEGFQPKLVEACKVINTDDKLRNKYGFSFIVDDLLDLKGSVTLKNMMVSYRNSNISTFLLLQSLTLVFRNTRCHASGYFLGQIRLFEDIEALMKRVLGSVGPFKGLKMEEKTSLYAEMTMNHQFLFYDPINNPNDLFRLE